MEKLIKQKLMEPKLVCNSLLNKMKKEFFLIPSLFCVILLIAFVSSISSTNYGINPHVISGGGANTSSENYSTNFDIGEITGDVYQGDYGNFIGFWPGSADSIPPNVIIINPTSMAYSSGTIPIEINLDEPGYCEYSLDSGLTNHTLVANASNSGFATSHSLGDGSYTLSAYCNDTLGNRNYTESVSFAVSIPVEGGGGDGGGGESAVTISTLVLSRTNLNVNLAINTNKKEIITVTNIGSTPRLISIYQKNLDEHIMFDDEPFELAPGESKDVELIFIALDETGIFTGKVNIGGTDVLVSLNIRTKLLLFDSNIAVLNEDYTVVQGYDLLTQVTIIPMGEKERMDVTLKYLIKDYRGKVYLTKSESVLVDEKIDFQRDFDTGLLPVGDYVVGLELIYPNGVAPSSAHFKVVPPSRSTIISKLIWFILILILLILIAIVIFLIIKKLRESRQNQINA